MTVTICSKGIYENQTDLLYTLIFSTPANVKPKEVKKKTVKSDWSRRKQLKHYTLKFRKLSSNILTLTTGRDEGTSHTCMDGGHLRVIG